MPACFLLLACCGFFPKSIFAQADFKEQEKSERLEKIKESIRELEALERAKVKAKKFALEYSATLSQGYNNNANLGSPRKGDLFTEQELILSGRRPLSENSELKLRFTIYNIIYHEFTQNNRLDNELALELETRLSDKLTLYTSSNLSYFKYPRENRYDYLSNRVLLALKHKLAERFYHRIAYSYRYKWFDELKKRDGTGNPLSEKREDGEHTLGWDWSMLLKRNFIKITNEGKLYNSNDSYFDYYDYLAHEVSFTWFRKVTRKFNTVLRAGYSRKNYDTRLVSELSTAQYDDTLTATVLLYYEMFPSFFLTARFIYLDNNSNSPLYDYVERLTSVGINYRF